MLSGRGKNLGTREIAHISQHANVITILVFFSGFFDVLPGQHSRQDRMAHWTKLHTCVVQHHDTSTKRAETVKKHVSVQVSVHTPHLRRGDVYLHVTKGRHKLLPDSFFVVFGLLGVT